jgi:hypothetical protein
MSERALSGADCPDVAELELASEGELPKRRLESVREHVRRCARCRERLGEASNVIAAYGEVICDAPPTPAEIDAADARYDRFRARLREEAAQPQARPRLRPAVVATSSWPALALKTRMKARPWLPVAAALPVIVLALVFSRSYTSTLKADELLTRAVVREQAAPKATVQRVQIHFTPSTRARAGGARVASGATITRDVGAAVVPTSPPPAFAEETLAALFAAHHLDLADPLSVSRFQAWRSSLIQKRDVVQSREGDGLLALKTMTDEGTLRSAEIVVRQSDYHPVRQNLDFENVGEVEIVEVATWVVSTPPRVQPAPAAPVASARPAPAVDPSALDDAELEARRVLHQAAADLDPRVSVARTNRAVEVRGTVQRAGRTSLEARLGAIGHVVPNLKAGPVEPLPAHAAAPNSAPIAPAADSTAPRDIAPVLIVPSPAESAPATEGAAPATAAPVTTALGRWRSRTFGDAASSAAFGPELARAVDRLRARAAALQALAVRYPEREAGRLAPESAQKLQDLVAEHYRDLANELDALDGQLAFFLGTSTRQTPRTAVAADWRVRAAQLAVETVRLRDAVRGLLQLEDVPLPGEIKAGRGEPAALSDVRRALDALWAAFP